MARSEWAKKSEIKASLESRKIVGVYVCACTPNVYHKLSDSISKEMWKNEANEEKEEEIAPRNWKFEQRLRARTLITLSELKASSDESKSHTQANCFLLLLVLLPPPLPLLIRSVCFFPSTSSIITIIIFFLLLLFLVLYVCWCVCAWAKFMEAGCVSVCVCRCQSTHCLRIRIVLYCIVLLDESFCSAFCHAHCVLYVLWNGGECSLKRQHEKN